MVVVALAQGAMLPVVRRRPVAGLTALLSLAGMQTAFLAPVPPLVTWLLPGLLSAYLVGVTTRRRTAWLGLAALAAGPLTALRRSLPAVAADEAGRLDADALDLLVGLGQIPRPRRRGLGDGGTPTRAGRRRSGRFPDRP